VPEEFILNNFVLVKYYRQLKVTSLRT